MEKKVEKKPESKKQTNLKEEENQNSSPNDQRKKKRKKILKMCKFYANHCMCKFLERYGDFRMIHYKPIRAAHEYMEECLKR